MGIETILATVLPIFGAPLIDGIKMIFSRITGISMGEPKSFQERIELSKADTDRLRALAEVDRVYGEVSRWVANLRASFRYIFIGLLMIVTLFYAIVYRWVGVPEVWAFLSQASGSALFFVIGDRVYFHIKTGK